MLHCGSCSGSKSSAACSMAWNFCARSIVTSTMSAKSCGPNSDHTPHTPNAAGRFVHSRLTMPLSYSASSGAVGSNRYGASWWNVGQAMLAIAVEQHRAQGRHEHHLVGVADDAVGLVDAGQQVAMASAEGQRAAVGRVDVQPDSCRRQTSAISSSGSNAPIGVAQAAAETAMIGTPRERRSASVSSSRFGSMRRRLSSAAGTI